MPSEPLKDKDYDLVSVVYHACQGLETCRQYAADAESEGDTAAVQFFQEARNKYEELASKGKDLLKQRL
jgi:hypothetical protein